MVLLTLKWCHIDGHDLLAKSKMFGHINPHEAQSSDDLKLPPVCMILPYVSPNTDTHTHTLIHNKKTGPDIPLPTGMPWPYPNRRKQRQDCWTQFPSASGWHWAAATLRFWVMKITLKKYIRNKPSNRGNIRCFFGIDNSTTPNHPCVFKLGDLCWFDRMQLLYWRRCIDVIDDHSFVVWLGWVGEVKFNLS